MHAADDWYKTFFAGFMVEGWLKAMPPEVTDQEVAFLRARLQVAPPARLLDVPCGGGRHSIALASAGYALTGVDISAAFLDAAHADGKHLPIDWQQRDMTDLPWPRAFDGAYSMGNSFGYLADADNERFLHAVAAALRPGARFVLDYPVALESLASNWQATGSYDFADIHWERKGRYDPATGRIIVEHTASRGNRTECKTMTQRAYTYRELCGMLEAAGFTDVQGCADLNDEPFTLGSKRLLLVATRTIQ